MSELVKFGRSTLDIAKVFGYIETEDGMVTVLSDRECKVGLVSPDSERFLRFLKPRVHIPKEPGFNAMADEGETPEPIGLHEPNSESTGQPELGQSAPRAG